MKLLITGAAGQLAQQIKEIQSFRALCDNKNPKDKISHDVLGEDLSGEDGSDLVELVSSSKLDIYFNAKLDICKEADLDSVLATGHYDYLLNCAAMTNVDACQSSLCLAYEVNARAVGNLARLCSKHKCSLIHISTDYVFDGDANKPYKEDYPCHPINEYGKSKLEGERLIEEVMRQSKSKSLIIRTSWLYSCYGSNFFLKILDLLKNKKELQVVSDQIGSPTYAYCLAEFILNIIESGAIDDLMAEKLIVHYSNEGQCSWYDFACKIRDLSPYDTCIKACSSDYYNSPARRPSYSVLDKSYIKERLSITIPTWEEALEKCYKDYSVLCVNNKD